MSNVGDERQPYTAVLIEREGRFFFYEPGLGVIASAENVDQAYNRFVEARENFVTEIEQAGLSSARVDVQQPQSTRSIGGELKIFMVKTTVVVMVIAIMAATLGLGIGHAVDRLSQSIGAIVAPLTSVSISDVSLKAAEIARDVREMPDGNKDLLIRSVGYLSREAEPVIAAWRNPPPPGAASEKSTGAPLPK